MHFIAISINHRTADVALREQVAFRDDALRLANDYMSIILHFLKLL
jgi:glutamyl-tRNA reductase